MGGGWSLSLFTGDARAGSAPTQSPDNYVLVPPIMNRDRSEPDRYAQSTFDWFYQKREMAMLLADFVTPGVHFHAMLVPTDDQLSTTATFAFPNVSWKGLWDSSADGSPNTWSPAAALRVRAQVNKFNPHTFASVYYSQLKDQPGPWLSLCGAQARPGLGGYMHVPLQDNIKSAIVGIRYGSMDLSVGAQGDVMGRSLDSMWVVKRIQLRTMKQHLLVGIQASPTPLIQSLEEAIQAPAPGDSNGHSGVVLQNLASNSDLRVFCEYQAGSPDASLSISMGLEAGSILQMSVHQHLARVRRIYNLLEDDDVVAITNYLDLGLRMRTPLDSAKKNVSFEAGAAWQVNSNLMIKALVNMQRVAAAIVLKSWWNPRVTGSIMGGWEFSSQTPCIGATLSMDNDGALQYERGLHSTHTGSLVRQKHVASESEAMTASGKRLMVYGGEETRTAQDAQLLVPPSAPTKMHGQIL
eukprot:jgi/Ulvmu1/4470/UM002_0195.1